MIARLLGILIVGGIVFMAVYMFIHIMNRWRRREAIKEEKLKKGG